MCYITFLYSSIVARLQSVQTLMHVDSLYQDRSDTRICTLLYYDYVTIYKSYNTKDYHTDTRLRLRSTDLELLALYAYVGHAVAGHRN